MAPFDPYLHVIKPMLAESRETPFDSKDHIFELKWDGTRALAIVRDGLRFQNRRLNYVESRYPDLAVHTRKPAILDGEIVVMNGPLPSFEKLQERERASGKIKIEYLAKTLPATYIVFDVLYVGDKSVMGLSQMERKAILPDLVEVDDRVVLSDYIEGRGVDYYNAVIARGLEGIIAKHKETRYHVGRRSKDWIKIKKKTTLDCIICGITAGEGEREDTFGSLILGAYFEGALFHVGRVGTGFSEKLRRTLFERLRPLRQEECPFPEVPEIDAHVGFWTKPEIVVEAQVGLLGPRCDEGWRGRGPHPLAAGPGVGPGDVRVPLEDDWRRHGDRLHHVRPEADDCGSQEERSEDRGRRRRGDVRSFHGPGWQRRVPRAAGEAEGPPGWAVGPRVRDGRGARREEDGRIPPQGFRHAPAAGRKRRGRLRFLPALAEGHGHYALYSEERDLRQPCGLR